MDLLTDVHAIEVDFSKKYYEAIGQSLCYAQATGKLPGILLIIEKEKDVRHLNYLLLVADIYNIAIWTIDSEFNIKKIEKSKD